MELMGDGSGLEALATALTSEPDEPARLRSLKLNSIGTFAPSHAIAWAPVWQALPKLPSLRELELGGNAFGTEAVAGLRRALGESRLDTLRLGSGALLPLSAHGVALTVDRGVLDLSGAGLTAADAALVSAALERLRREGHAAPITALDLSGNALALEAIADEAELVSRHDTACALHARILFPRVPATSLRTGGSELLRASARGRG